ncbi:acyl-protein synthetase [Pendulispora brunnea]|uniref:Acyl-protein synthetase n=1 Tax=Pendulispora brunnea TaxID=2905690 RepID=A0ABZ2K5Z8_9BACT
MDARRNESEALHERARAFVRAFDEGNPMPEPFDALASDLARFQARYVPGYAKLLAARGLDASRFARAGDAPAVPTDAFKVARVSAFPEQDTPITFRTSGTTVGARGSHPFRDAGTYERAAVAFARRTLLQGFPERVHVLVLGPSAKDLPDSSLSHMNDAFVHAFGLPHDGDVFFLRDDILDLAALDETVARILVTSDAPVLLLATAFACAYLLDGLGDADFRLPKGSRVMQTGGFKGKSREIEPHDLRRELARVFHIAEDDIRGEYGMTELSSQFYEERGGGPYLEPPWARVVPVDPVTLEPVPQGAEGIARIEDLMNVDSAFAVLAADRVRRVSGGFELLGRTPGAPPRGCSLTVEEILGS